MKVKNEDSFFEVPYGLLALRLSPGLRNFSQIFLTLMKKTKENQVLPRAPFMQDRAGSLDWRGYGADLSDLDLCAAGNRRA